MNKITFKQFIYTYNFRYINDLGKEPYSFDTQIIRIYPPNDDCDDSEWFEFGIYDFSNKDYTWKICEKILNKDILNSYIENIQYNDDYNNTVTIYLTKHNLKESDD